MGPGPDRLGLKCYLASGGNQGEGVGGNFMYLNHNFSLVTAKRMHSFILTFRYASFGNDEACKILYR